MSEKPKGPDVDQQTAIDNRKRRQPGARGAGRQADAIDAHGNVDGEKLKLNQDRLGVGRDHRTDAMKKGKRGSYP